MFLYGINVLLASLTLSLLIRYIARESSLVPDDIADENLRRITKQRWFLIGVNSIAVALALIVPLSLSPGTSSKLYCRWSSRW